MGDERDRRDLTGRVALVTGGGRAVGLGIARALAARGAAVAVNDIDGARAEAAAGSLRDAGLRAEAAAFDATDGGAIRAAVGRVAETLGPVDVLVHNAGIPPGGRLVPFRGSTRADWEPWVQLNLFGAMECAAAVLDGMCDRGWGRIVVISSGASRQGLRSGVSVYGAAKAGAEALVRHLAVEHGRAGITANAVALGLMEETTGVPSDPARAKTVPVGRLGTPRDVGELVAFLASDAASWLTGQTIQLNGGNFWT